MTNVVTVGGLRLEAGSRFLRLGREYELVEPYNGTLWIARDVITGCRVLTDVGLPR